MAPHFFPFLPAGFLIGLHPSSCFNSMFLLLLCLRNGLCGFGDGEWSGVVAVGVSVVPVVKKVSDSLVWRVLCVWVGPYPGTSNVLPKGSLPSTLNPEMEA